MHVNAIDVMNKNDHADIASEQGWLVISGNLNFGNAPRILQKSLGLMEQESELIFDFAKMASSNSVVLALMVEWLRYGEKNNKRARFENLSEKIKSIAKVAGLEGLI